MSALRVRTWPVAFGGPLVDLLDDQRGMAWLQEDRGLVGIGVTRRLEGGAGTDRFERISREFAELADASEVDDHVGVPGTGLIGLATFAFDDRSGGSCLVVPELVVGRHDGTTFVTRISEDDPGSEPPPIDPAPASSGPIDRPRFAGSSMPDVHWLEAVAEAVRRIDAGDLDKVVLARDHGVWAKVPFSPKRLATRLQARFPACFTFVVDGLVGATPELLVRKNGAAVVSRALAGTAARGADGASDAEQAEALLDSKKDRWEHELAARTVGEVLEPLCASFEAEPEPHVLRLDNVLHLGTWFRGTLSQPDGMTSLDLAAALHPTAAVGGVPTDTAIELIRELEGMDRGRYAGPVGWVDGNGDGEFGIALRCAELSGARARLFSGAGIVRGSLPEDELEETRVKLLAMQSAFAP